MPPLLVCQYQPVLCMMPSFTIIALFGTQFVRCALSIDLGKENRLIPEDNQIEANRCIQAMVEGNYKCTYLPNTLSSYARFDPP